MNNMSLIRKIHAYDFAIYELVLYLDTHPTDNRALAMLEKFRKERAEAIKEYERLNGNYAPTHSAVKIGNRWTWVDSPWPWENEANM